MSVKRIEFELKIITNTAAKYGICFSKLSGYLLISVHLNIKWSQILLLMDHFSSFLYKYDKHYENIV